MFKIKEDNARNALREFDFRHYVSYRWSAFILGFIMSYGILSGNLGYICSVGAFICLFMVNVLFIRDIIFYIKVLRRQV